VVQGWPVPADVTHCVSKDVAEPDITNWPFTIKKKKI
jgi:hypothetical protein